MLEMILFNRGTYTGLCGEASSIEKAIALKDEGSESYTSEHCLPQCTFKFSDFPCLSFSSRRSLLGSPRHLPTRGGGKEP